MPRLKTNQLIAADATSALLLLRACGSDGNSSAANADACDAWIAADGGVIGYLLMGEADADSVKAALDAPIAAAPDDIVDTMTELKSEAQPQLEDLESDASVGETERDGPPHLAEGMVQEFTVSS